jgi:hypothetical protein
MDRERQKNKEQLGIGPQTAAPHGSVTWKQQQPSLGGQQQQQNSNGIQEKEQATQVVQEVTVQIDSQQQEEEIVNVVTLSQLHDAGLAELSPQKTDFDTRTNDFILQCAEYHKKDRHAVLYSQ